MRGGALLCLCGLAAGPALALNSASAPGNARAAPPALDLDAFEDDDCLEADGADILIPLMHDMCEILDQVLYASDREVAWRVFEAWADENIGIMVQVSSSLFIRPYCEPGKVAWMAIECLLLLRRGSSGVENALSCAETLDEDYIAQMTPRGSDYGTRLHLMLRSPWPAFRLLDLLVRLHPESDTTRMGACRPYTNWQNEPDLFDWPWFKPLVTAASDAAVMDSTVFDLRPQDGPLSRQYRARWLRVYGEVPGISESIAFSDDVFEAYKEHHYRAGCHLGVISSYVLQVLLIHQRDIEGRLHRYTASVAQLINLHAPFPHMIRSDWPVFRLLHIASLLQRAPPAEAWQGGPDELRAPPDAARALCDQVREAAESAPPGPGAGAHVYVTSSWGPFSRFARAVLTRWSAVLAADVLIVFLALDAEALYECANTFAAKVHCVNAPRRLGIENAIAKYLALASISNLGITAVWLDLDIYVARDPSAHIAAALAAPPRPDLVFARHLASAAISPAIVVVRGTAEATDAVIRYAGWLRENPYLLDHQGWDQFLGNRNGDFSAGFDYQGRNVTVKDDKGPAHSFLPQGGAVLPSVRYSSLGGRGELFGSGDGWHGRADASDLCLFHFWGMAEPQEELFQLFYPYGPLGFPPRTLGVLARYRRVLVSGPTLAAALRAKAGGRGGRAPYLVALSYADGCCQKSLKKNREQAISVGVDEARAYGRRDLGPDWVARNSEILSQRRGAGWWLWKPYLILRTLNDRSIPWYTGVVLWVDAGNYLYADPRPLVTKALQESDVVALRLKFCLEADWTSAVTLRHLNVSGMHTIIDRPQVGAYFLAFRKTPVAIAFAEEWLRLSEDPKALLGAAAEGAAAEAEIPSFQKHQADQSILSILFKQHGFHALSLEEGHRVVKLARWRE